MDFKEKKEEMMKKYERAIFAIAETNKVDIDVGFDMLEANICRGAHYDYVNVAEFLKDKEELTELAKEM